VSVEDCLPAELRTPAPTITPITVGMSGAAVYRVDAGGHSYVLKVSPAHESADDWHNKLALQQLASQAGVAPRVVHVDDARRAIVSAFVVDRGFPALIGNPQTRAAAVVQVGQTLRRIHDLPPPAGVQTRDPRGFMATMYRQLSAAIALPAFVQATAQRALDEAPPAHDRPLVLSHNDVNPTNLIYDGEHIFLLDWDTAGLNDAFYDAAGLAVFLRMDEPTCLAMLSAHDGAPVTSLPPRFAYNRRLIAAMCGSIFLHLAHVAGRSGPTDADTLEATSTLAELYPQMRAGALDLTSGDGRWRFGLALIKESALY
jgi:aminoglycoside phosphotransferase (APT) family kinase protein